VCNWAILSGVVPDSWDRAYIRCLLKQGKDKLVPESYRPISLICTDCKVFTGILAARLQQFGDAIFGPEQTGFLRGRNTAMAAMRVADFFSRHRSSFPVLLDYAKAYDRVDHGWVEVCLGRSGIGPEIQRVLLNLLRGMKSRLIVNGELGEWISNRSGVRQGDPLSPLLFLLCIQPLLARLKQLKIFTQAHCDDMVVAVSRHNIRQVLTVLNEYDGSTGAAVNPGKSVLISPKLDAGFSHPFRVATGDRYLGFWLTSGGELKLNPELVKSTVSSLRRIQNLHLSWAGKETVLASYFRPRYLYQMVLVEGAEKVFGNIEAWFLGGCRDEFLEGRRYVMPLAVAKMRHPYTRLRLRPLVDELRDRRTYLVLRLLRSQFRVLIPGKESESGLPESIADSVRWSNAPLWNGLLVAWKESPKTYRCFGTRGRGGPVHINTGSGGCP